MRKAGPELVDNYWKPGSLALNPAFLLLPNWLLAFFILMVVVVVVVRGRFPDAFMKWEESQIPLPTGVCRLRMPVLSQQIQDYAQISTSYFGVKINHHLALSNIV